MIQDLKKKLGIKSPSKEGIRILSVWFEDMEQALEKNNEVPVPIKRDILTNAINLLSNLSDEEVKEIRISVDDYEREINSVSIDLEIFKTSPVDR